MAPVAWTPTEAALEAAIAIAPAAEVNIGHAILNELRNLGTAYDIAYSPAAEASRDAALAEHQALLTAWREALATEDAVAAAAEATQIAASGSVVEVDGTELVLSGLDLELDDETDPATAEITLSGVLRLVAAFNGPLGNLIEATSLQFDRTLTTFDVDRGTVTTVPDAVWGTPTGNDVTITSAGANLPTLSAGEYFEVLDPSEDDNIGVYEATGSPTTSSVDATKQPDPGAVPPVAATAASADVNPMADDSVDQVDTPQPMVRLTLSFGGYTEELELEAGTEIDPAAPRNPLGDTTPYSRLLSAIEWISDTRPANQTVSLVGGALDARLAVEQRLDRASRLPDIDESDRAAVLEARATARALARPPVFRGAYDRQAVVGSAPRSGRRNPEGTITYAGGDILHLLTLQQLEDALVAQIDEASGWIEGL